MAGDALPLGFELGDYRIDRVLGQGGFGIVYRATHLERGYHVAIKELFPFEIVRRHPSLSVVSADAAKQRLFVSILRDFNREAALLFRFPHPNLPRIHAVLKAHNTLYLVMDYETGQSLERWIETVPMGARTERIMQVLAAVCDPLARLHRNRVFHHDIKPDNIILRDDGTPVLLDFGLAGHGAAGASSDGQALHFATDGYSPIELYTGARTGPWTDIYALAATAYRLAGGTAPVDAKARAKALQQGTPDPLRPLALRPHNARQKSFVAAIGAGLQFDAARRPDSVEMWTRGWRQIPSETPEPAGRIEAPRLVQRYLRGSRIVRFGLPAMMAGLLALCYAALFAR